MGSDELKIYKSFWKRVLCAVIGHDPVEDHERNVFCYRCWRKNLGVPAKMTAAERIFGPQGKRQLERERKERLQESISLVGTRKPTQEEIKYGLELESSAVEQLGVTPDAEKGREG